MHKVNNTEEDIAATKIQARWRGKQAREKFKNRDQHKAATFI